MRILLVVILGFLAFFGLLSAVSNPDNRPLMDTERRCMNWADKLAPVGYYDREQYMSAYRACIARNSAR